MTCPSGDSARPTIEATRRCTSAAWAIRCSACRASTGASGSASSAGSAGSAGSARSARSASSARPAWSSRLGGTGSLPARRYGVGIVPSMATTASMSSVASAALRQATTSRPAPPSTLVRMAAMARLAGLPDPADRRRGVQPQLVVELVVQGQEQLVLPTEVVVEAAHAGPGAADDLGHARLGETLLPEHRPRGLQKALPGRHRAGLLADRPRDVFAQHEPDDRRCAGRRPAPGPPAPGIHPPGRAVRPVRQPVHSARSGDVLTNPYYMTVDDLVPEDG